MYGKGHHSAHPGFHGGFVELLASGYTEIKALLD